MGYLNRLNTQELLCVDCAYYRNLSFASDDKQHTRNGEVTSQLPMIARGKKKEKLDVTFQNNLSLLIRELQFCTVKIQTQDKPNQYLLSSRK